MALGDIYNILAMGTVDGNLMINSFWYVRDGVSGEPDPATILGDFSTKVIQPVRATQANSSIWTMLKLVDLDPSGLDFELAVSPAQAGNVAAEALPPFCCWSYLMTRRNRSTFNGHKRFSGVPETWQNDGSIASGHDTAIAAVVTGLNADITDGDLTYNPCIVSRILNGVPRTTPLVNLLSTVAFKGISSQNTRKYGRGA